MRKLFLTFYRENTRLIILVAISLLLSLTPVYTLGYLLFIIAFCQKLRFIKAFDTKLADFIGALLLFMATIMMTGIITSYLQIPNLPIINIFVACILFGITLSVRPHADASKVKLFNRSDLVAVLATLVLPLIMAVTFGSVGLSAGIFASVNQDGWDNSAHLNIMQSIEKNHNYFYSTSPETINGQKLYNNYPQGWHLASTSIADGILPQVFNSSSYGVIAMLTAYLVVIFVWYFLAIYTITKSVWWLTGKIRYAKPWIMFVLLQIPILTVLIPSIYHGYANYIGVIPYVVLASVMTYQVYAGTRQNDILFYLAQMTLLAIGVGLIWVLPVVPVALMVLFVLFSIKSYKKLFTIRLLPLVILLLVSGIVFLAYVSILRHDVGFSQLDVGKWIVAFPGVMLGLVLVAVLVLRLRVMKLNISALFVVIAPFLLFMSALWLLLYARSYAPGYYHAKMFGILFVVIALFAIPALANLVDKISVSGDSFKRIQYLFAVTAPLVLVGSLFIFADQAIDLSALRPIRSVYSMNKHELKYVASWVRNTDSQKNGDQLLVLRSNFRENINRAMMFNRLNSDRPELFLASGTTSIKKSLRYADTCLMDYLYTGSSAGVKVPYKKAVTNLSQCLSVRRTAGLATTIFLPKKAISNLAKVNTDGVNLVYY